MANVMRPGVLSLEFLVSEQSTRLSTLQVMATLSKGLGLMQYVWSLNTRIQSTQKSPDATQMDACDSSFMLQGI